MAEKKDNKPGTGFRITSILYLLLFIGFGYILLKDDGSELSGEATYTEFKEYMQKGYVSNLVIFSNMNSMDMYIKPDSARYVFGDRASAQPLTRPVLTVGIGSLDNLQAFIDESEESGTFTGKVEYRKRSHTLIDILISTSPLILIIVFWIILSRRMSGGANGGGGVFNVGKSKARVYERGKSDRVTFKDVAGQAEAKTEVEEIVEFLKNPKK